MKQKCEVPGCDKEHMWMKDGKLVCSQHYLPPNEIKWVQESKEITEEWLKSKGYEFNEGLAQAKLPEAPLLTVDILENDNDYQKLWEKIEPIVDPVERDFRINIHKGNENIVDDETMQPYNWPVDQRPFKSKQLENKLRGYQVWEPTQKFRIDEDALKELDEKMKRFSQGLGNVELVFSPTGITTKYTEPDKEGVCETFSPEENKYCPEPALRREDCYNHYLCEQCYQNYLNKEYPKKV